MGNLDKIARCDPAIYDAISAALTQNDRRSLLLIQNVVRGADPAYCYLEIGSELGGSLFPHLVDDRCGRAISVDLRVQSQPDERGAHFSYAGVTTAKMIETLRPLVPDDELCKLATFDADIAELDRAAIGDQVRLALIDGEHTNRAAFRDFVKVRHFLHEDALVAFHDANLVFDAILNIETMLADGAVEHCGCFLPDFVYAVGLGKFAPLVRHQFGPLGLDREAFIANARRQLNLAVCQNLAGAAPGQ